MPAGGQPTAYPIPTSNSQAEENLENDMLSLINLGLSLGDIERLWANIPGLSAERVQETGRALLARRQGEQVRLARQTSLGMELLSRMSVQDSSGSPERGAVEEAVASRILEELKEPPEELRDPIMLTLMDEPCILSSGHVFDRTTVYHPNGGMRFESCPMTRAALRPEAYPVARLKAKIVDFKLKKLHQILAVLDSLSSGSSSELELLPALLEGAGQLLEGLGASRYHEQSARYSAHQLRALGPRFEDWPRLLADAAASAVGVPSLAAALQLKHEALEAEVRRRWLAAEHAAAFSLAGASLAAFNAKLRQQETPSRASVQPPPSAIEAALTTRQLAWVRVIDGLTASSDPSVWAAAVPAELRIAVAAVGKPAAEGADALPFWRLTLRLATSARGDVAAADEVAEYKRCVGRLAAELYQAQQRISSDGGDPPPGYVVEGAGCEIANGTYMRDGEYGSSPRFVHEAGQLWMLRYQLPSGNQYWCTCSHRRRIYRALAAHSPCLPTSRIPCMCAPLTSLRPRFRCLLSSRLRHCRQGPTQRGRRRPIPHPDPGAAAADQRPVVQRARRRRPRAHPAGAAAPAGAGG